ncbi:MAG: hypothetical protein J0L66_01140 [Cytophagales bacterium]|nr:hypothetical protein [Cytophagales bacterium]
MQQPKKPQNALKTSHTASGIRFENRWAVHFKITNKDILLVAGILVAILITITTFLLETPTQTESTLHQPVPGLSWGVFQTLGKTLISKF